MITSKIKVFLQFIGLTVQQQLFFCRGYYSRAFLLFRRRMGFSLGMSIIDYSFQLWFWGCVPSIQPLVNYTSTFRRLNHSLLRRKLCPNPLACHWAYAHSSHPSSKSILLPVSLLYSVWMRSFLSCRKIRRSGALYRDGASQCHRSN